MKFVAEFDESPRRRFIIESDEAVGYYLYVFEGERCLQDYLQDTLELALEQAQSQFNVARHQWKEVK